MKTLCFVLAIGFTMIALSSVSAHAQETQQVYVLDHPIDPDQLLIVTQDGRYPFKLLAGTDCSWVQSDSNVILTNRENRVWTITDGADATCNLIVGDQIDSSVAPPCSQNESGECDIQGEHRWT